MSFKPVQAYQIADKKNDDTADYTEALQEALQRAAFRHVHGQDDLTPVAQRVVNLAEAKAFILDAEQNIYAERLAKLPSGFTIQGYGDNTVSELEAGPILAAEHERLSALVGGLQSQLTKLESRVAALEKQIAAADVIVSTGGVSRLDIGQVQKDVLVARQELAAFHQTHDAQLALALGDLALLEQVQNYGHGEKSWRVMTAL